MLLPVGSRGSCFRGDFSFSRKMSRARVTFRAGIFRSLKSFRKQLFRSTSPSGVPSLNGTSWHSATSCSISMSTVRPWQSPGNELRSNGWNSWTCWRCSASTICGCVSGSLLLMNLYVTSCELQACWCLTRNLGTHTGSQVFLRSSSSDGACSQYGSSHMKYI